MKSKSKKIWVVVTPPHNIDSEHILCNQLLWEGVDFLHIRKPDMNREEIENFIKQIDPRYHSQLILHSHFELAQVWGCGIHLNKAHRKHYVDYCDSIKVITTSCHAINEVDQLEFIPYYVWLSPIFDSISKIGYVSTFNKHALREWLNKREPSFKIIALGGVDTRTSELAFEMGFDGVALLGAIWHKPKHAVETFLIFKRAYVVTIGGTDPSGSAGLPADIKTVAANGGYALPICSALCYQNEEIFEALEWIDVQKIIAQLEMIFRIHRPTVFKIGVIKDESTLVEVIRYIRAHSRNSIIIWDPILKASAGFDFHEKRLNIAELLHEVDIVTPNHHELLQFVDEASLESIEIIAKTSNCTIIWKGGHQKGNECCDWIITPNGHFKHETIRDGFEKHGTGCSYASALSTRIALGDRIESASRKAQLYLSQMISNESDLLLSHINLPINIAYNENMKHIKLQFITHASTSEQICKQVEQVCRGGCKWIQLRMKGASMSELLETGKKVKAICQRYNALFLINDHVSIALQLDADGVHLGKEDTSPIEARQMLGENKIIGATCNTFEDIQQRQLEQVDYIGVGPYRFTTTKEKLSPTLGLDGYRTLLQQMKDSGIELPLFAIGGIERADIPLLKEVGISYFALSSLLLEKDNIIENTKEVLSLIR